VSAVDEKTRTEEDEQHDDEHDADEHDDQGDDDVRDLEEQPVHDPAEGLEEPTEQMMVELGAACNDHHDHVRAIMGGFVEGFVPCDECNGIGLAIPRPAAPKLQPRQGAVECSVCAGFGELELPTKREQFKVEQCTNCNGKGWVGAGNMPVATGTQQVVDQYPAGEQPQPQQPTHGQPPSTDPRVEQLRSEGFIVLEKPNA
jgi:hypothetical protein